MSSAVPMTNSGLIKRRLLFELDIDFIAIRAEAGSETATRRTYNYRVGKFFSSLHCYLHHRISLSPYLFFSHGQE